MEEEAKNVSGSATIFETFKAFIHKIYTHIFLFLSDLRFGSLLQDYAYMVFVRTKI